jgi:hypothetical protein
MNITELIHKLNDNCENKEKQGFNKWDEYDLDIKNDYYRSYCSWWFTSYELCSNCKDTIEWYRNNQPTIQMQNILEYLKKNEQNMLEIKDKIKEMENKINEMAEYMKNK